MPRRSPPAFGCGCAAAAAVASRTTPRRALSSLAPSAPAPFAAGKPPAFASRPRRSRPSLRACATSSESEEPDLSAPPAPPSVSESESESESESSSSAPSGPHSSWSVPPRPTRPASVPPSPLPPALVTSVSLNLNGTDALPSVASLKRYTNDLRPKLDYLEPRARERVLSALEVANVAHKGQKRKSGEPFIIHPIAVAAILADMRMDRDCVIAGLLHDTVEDTPITLEELECLFGRDVRKIVEGETKFSKLAKKVHGDKASRSEGDPVVTREDDHLPTEWTSHLSANAADLVDKTHTRPPRVPAWQKERQKREDEQQKQADNLRAMFLAMTEDVRVIIVKLADRLHNMRTLSYMTPAKQKKISKETLEFFAPLAHRLGMRRVKSELEELSFMYLHPEEYHQLKYEVDAMLRRWRFDYHLNSAEAVVKDVLEQDRFLYNMIQSVEVVGSTKELYSIYRRMLAGENLASMPDIATMRVVVDLDPGVDSNQACYHVLGRIHTMWKPLPKHLKDYIAFPKPNGYQSLHTTVLLGPKFAFLAMEIQIRTAEMHRIAEEGVAAELFQSGSVSKAVALSQEDDQEDSALGLDGEWRRRTKGWLISIREYIEEFSSSRDLVDAVRRDLLGNRVFVFTPKGRIVDLPKDSTPIDVAYRIHSDVGHKTIGAKVNGRMVNLDYKLQNADVVKIIGSNSSPGPSSEWIGYAKSRTARQKIRQFLRARDRDNMLDRGRRILEEEARSLLEPIPSEAALTDILPRLSSVIAAATGMKNITTVDDLCIAVAKGNDEQTEFPLERTVLGLLRDRRRTVLSKAASVSHQQQSPAQKARAKRIWEGQAIKARGVITEQEIVLSPCCHPIRGDEILGIRVNCGESDALLVHRVRCEHMVNELKKRPASTNVVSLKWAQELRKSDESNREAREPDELSGSKTQNDRSGPGICPTDGRRPCQPARVLLIARDCDGLLSYVSGVLASMGTSIRRSITVTDPDTLVATLAFEVLVKDTYHLRRIIERIETCDEVESAVRIGPNESEEYFPLTRSRSQKRISVSTKEMDETSLRALQDGHPVVPTEMEIDDFNMNNETSTV